MLPTSLIITAAGKGTRFGAINKLFLDLDNKPLIIHTCESFLGFDFFEETIITIALEEKKYLEDLLKEYKLDQFFKVIIGGATRKESVQLAMQELAPVKRIFIHDGARPNISKRLIKALYQAAQEYLAVIPGIPVVDTIKLANDQNFVENTPPRNKLFQIQTPQVFDYAALQEIYQKANNSLANSITDEAMLFEFFDIPIKIIPGERSNLKITYPEDLLLLKKAD
ncbi:MAG: 2-C-methyl-D-erythritol 4-phosphate cytidylyltransferase [Candidatus Margulisiibacteriota bacterium]|jgi:2-C-methyl-D-erythritol 4-phosphate cytidylyltransferase